MAGAGAYMVKAAFAAKAACGGALCNPLALFASAGTRIFSVAGAHMLSVAGASGFGSYVLAITGAVILLTVADLIMPKGRTSKYIKSALSVFLVLIILTPIVKIKTGEIDVSNIFSRDAVTADYSFTGRLNRIKADSLQLQAQAHLQKNGIKDAYITIIYTDRNDGITVDYASVDLSAAAEAGNGGADVAKRAKELAAEFFNISAERVFTYGAE